MLTVLSNVHRCKVFFCNLARFVELLFAKSLATLLSSCLANIVSGLEGSFACLLLEHKSRPAGGLVNRGLVPLSSKL